MKKINELTLLEANYILDNKLNSLLILSNEELDQFIKIDSLNTSFIELPPINVSDNNDLKKLLAGVDGSTLLGKLEWIYFKTYLNGGRPLYRNIGDGYCEIFLDFSKGIKSVITFNPGGKPMRIDGHNGLRALWVLEIYSNEKSLLLIPSISLKITTDTVKYGPNSVMNFVGTMQPNAGVGLVNRMFTGFQFIEIEMIYNNPEIKNELLLTYI